MNMKFTWMLAPLMALAMSPLAMADHHKEGEKDAAHAEVPSNGVSVLIPTQGNDIRGIITLQQADEGVKVTGKVIGLTPGKHGFHIHEFGDLRSLDGTSAGGHYAPKGHKHGGPDDDERHAGDLGNITANDDGVAEVDIMAKGLKVHLVLGRAIVVHGGADDLKSQPSGAAGPRVAVGVIGVANTETESK